MYLKKSVWSRGAAHGQDHLRTKAKCTGSTLLYKNLTLMTVALEGLTTDHISLPGNVNKKLSSVMETTDPLV